MLGAIIGDIVGSKYEFNNIKTKTFKLFDDEKSTFTDDTLMTLAVFKTLKDCDGNYANLQTRLIENMKVLAEHYPDVGYGDSFKKWLQEIEPKPYNSWGNGAAMRVAPVAYFANNLKEVKTLSKLVTEISHNHPEGLKGAEATAIAIYMAKNGATKASIKDYIEKNYYPLDFDYQDLQKNYTFKVSCQNSVPQAIWCFLQSKSFEDTLRTTVSIGGDTDTLCAISGAIAGAFYGIPKDILNEAKQHLDLELLVIANDMEKMTKEFETKKIKADLEKML